MFREYVNILTQDLEFGLFFGKIPEYAAARSVGTHYSWSGTEKNRN